MLIYKTYNTCGHSLIKYFTTVKSWLLKSDLFAPFSKKENAKINVEVIRENINCNIIIETDVEDLEYEDIMEVVKKIIKERALIQIVKANQDIEYMKEHIKYLGIFERQ